MPWSIACRKIGSAPASSRVHSLNPREVFPKLMQPSAMRLTFNAEAPRRVYSMINSLLRSCVDGVVGSPHVLGRHARASRARDSPGKGGKWRHARGVVGETQHQQLTKRPV